jgi:hypothetical protein
MFDKEKKNDASSNETIDNKAEALSERDLENVTGGATIKFMDYVKCMDCNQTGSIFPDSKGNFKIEHALGCPAKNIQVMQGKSPKR